MPAISMIAISKATNLLTFIAKASFLELTRKPKTCYGLYPAHIKCRGGQEPSIVKFHHMDSVAPLHNGFAPSAFILKVGANL
jgi:hypothetical protein